MELVSKRKLWRPRYVPLALFVLASVAADVLVAITASELHSGIFAMAFLGALFAQSGVLAIWLAVGRTHIFVRFPAVLAADAVLSVLLSMSPDYAHSAAASGSFLLMLTATTSGLVLAWRTARTCAAPRWNATEDGEDKPRWRFSLWGAFLLITCFSLFFAVVRLTEIPKFGFVEVSHYMCAYSLYTLAAAAFIFGRARLFVRLPVFVLIVGLATFWIYSIGEFIWMMLPFSISHASYSLAAFGLYRLAIPRPLAKRPQQ